ncbi:hypothetical protein DNX69_10905 [Rhodopseudomonas palustris]|uniref:Uncharacterized protein n=2 Tax=Rhodopseudomonas palustris TaxID=1076 RepID=A0A323UI59_RHOPL|nr:hypothetical protein DNX69_10905 [Rhodopseudomonas palustris]
MTVSTVFVERDGSGAIKGVYANCQPGCAEELNSPENADVAAFLSRFGAAVPAAEPVSQPPRVVASAMGITVENGDVAAIRGSYNIAAALYLGVGQVMLLFFVALADDDYFVVVQGHPFSTAASETTADHFIVETKDGAGDLVDPSCLSIQVYKV